MRVAARESRGRGLEGSRATALAHGCRGDAPKKALLGPCATKKRTIGLFHGTARGAGALWGTQSFQRRLGCRVTYAFNFRFTSLIREECAKI